MNAWKGSSADHQVMRHAYIGAKVWIRKLNEIDCTRVKSVQTL